MAAARDSAVVLCALARPALRGRSRADWTVVLAFGLTLGLMNWAFYQSFARIPLGIAVTIEFAGPLTLAVLGSRRPRDLLWAGLAVVGVVLLGTERADLDPVGVAFALLAATMWACYILLSAQTGRRWAGIDGLALASVVAGLAVTPLLARRRRHRRASATRGCCCSARPSGCSARWCPTAASWWRCARCRRRPSAC